MEDHPHEALFREKGGRGFPTLKFMSAEGKILGEPSGRSVEAFEASLHKLMAVTDLENRIAAGEKGLEKELFFVKLRMGQYTYEEAKADAAKLKDLDQAQQAELKSKLIDLEFDSIMEMMSTVRSQEEADEMMPKVGAKFFAMYQAGKIPQGQEKLGTFWSLIMEHAEAKGDADLFEIGLDALKVAFAEEEAAKDFFDQGDVKLKEMREKVKVDS